MLPISTLSRESTSVPPRMMYVAGFVFDENQQNVLLIRKTKPDWQAGKLNGVGGKIEGLEKPLEAMVREFHEEAGRFTLGWKYQLHVSSPVHDLHVFALHSPDVFDKASAQTEEKLERVPVHPLPNDVVPNLHWMVPLILDTSLVTPLKIQMW